MAMIVTVMPTWPVNELRIIWDGTLVGNSHNHNRDSRTRSNDGDGDKCRLVSGPLRFPHQFPPPSMTMRFRTLGGAHHDHQRERRSSDECW
jgi:hypothetical protein